MAYSTAKISTTADCDLLLAMAAKEKSNLDFKKLSDERQKTNYSDNSIEIDAELLAVEAEIAATTTIINTLPEGTSKDDAVKKKTKLEYKKFLLDNRKEGYGAVALLGKEMELAIVDLELGEIATFTAEVTARKAAL
ncbi:hypothetical protein QWZ08_16445 [Ferruginibacter paludis]|uniref:hypothetical protein n=1 Tax=Ferruginibacter paludis TaxID=1310417 RepID=UPI0025B2956B|nr:hypothetical protein [Ferruginibacter paludis]MDN3657241.1 hypothetical protein [Ferruginibacter paludis]